MKITTPKQLPVGTAVRVKLPGVRGTAGELLTKTTGAPRHVSSGNLWVKVEGLPNPVPVKDVEVIPVTEQSPVGTYAGIGAGP